MDDDTNAKIKQLQTIEQNLQAYSAQKVQLQSQELEIETSLAELEKSQEAYRIIGNIMVKADKAEVVEELKEKLRKLKEKLSVIKKQEERLQGEADEIQKSIMSKMD